MLSCAQLRITMKFLVVLVTLLLSRTEAARRTRKTTTAAPTAATIEERQLGFPGQPEEPDTPWDRIDIQKLDPHADFWKDKPASYENETTEFVDQTLTPGRQLYPGFPNNPGDSNELPSPISPTIAPIPTPAPGCLATRGQFPSPRSCANYLNCWDEIVIEETCPNGLLFNDITYVCDFDYNVHCGNRPLPTPKPPLPPGSKHCPDLNGRYRSSTNCSEFYVCVVGRPIKFSCPRGLVYNDILNVCDYLYNVDCKGSATPKPLPPTKPTYPPTKPTYPPTHPTQPPTYPPYPPTYHPHPPTYPPQPPTYPPQPPAYPPQQPSYPGNPWLNKIDPDPWHQRPVASQLEIDEAQKEQEALASDQKPGQVQDDPTESATLSNPWTILQAIPAGLSKVPCENGDLHRLNESCSNVVVCRDGRPQLVQCPSGYTYDKPSDSCKPFTIAKC